MMKNNLKMVLIFLFNFWIINIILSPIKDTHTILYQVLHPMIYVFLGVNYLKCKKKKGKEK